MDTLKCKVTRHTRSIGWGYNTSPSQGEHGYFFEPPSRPDHTGTIRQVLDAIDRDREYASIKSGGTYYSEAWFYQGKRIVSVDGMSDVVLIGEALNTLIKFPCFGSVTIEVAE